MAGIHEGFSASDRYYDYDITPNDMITSDMVTNEVAPAVMSPRDKEAKEKKEFVDNFDMERLAQEVDEMFQAKVENIVVDYIEFRDKEKEKFVLSLQETTSEFKQRVIAEIEKGRTTIVIPEREAITVQHMDHPEFENVCVSLSLNNKAMLVGPAGTGKTYMVADIAARMGLPFYKYSCSRDSSVHDLLGYKQPTSETYLETVFLQAYENGGIFLVDEYDAMSGDMSLFFNGVADNSKFISVPHRDTKPIAEKHKDFHIVMCGNTWGKGSHEFTGRDFQDNALMDRFRLDRHHIGYHFELEKQLCTGFYPHIGSLRNKLEQLGSYLSTRNVEDIANYLKAGRGSMQDIVKILGQDLTETDREELSRLSF